MKMPRFFIMIGACALVFAFTLSALESTIRPCWAGSLPIMRADPWSGDPEEPGFAKQLPFDDDGAYSHIANPYELSAQLKAPSAETIRPPWWTRLWKFFLATDSRR